jgi:hypothetical protein
MMMAAPSTEWIEIAQERSRHRQPALFEIVQERWRRRLLPERDEGFSGCDVRKPKPLHPKP